jgi:hypothetical protein
LRELHGEPFIFAMVTYPLIVYCIATRPRCWGIRNVRIGSIARCNCLWRISADCGRCRRRLADVAQLPQEHGRRAGLLLIGACRARARSMIYAANCNRSGRGLAVIMPFYRDRPPRRLAMSLTSAEADATLGAAVAALQRCDLSEARCTVRVGNEPRTWRQDETIIFDDSSPPPLSRSGPQGRSCIASRERFALLYTMLVRLRASRSLDRGPADPLVRRLEGMAQGGAPRHPQDARFRALPRSRGRTKARASSPGSSPSIISSAPMPASSSIASPACAGRS